MKKYMTKALAGVAVVAAALIAGPTAAMAAPGYPDTSDVVISQQTNIAPGGSVTFTISNLMPNSPIVFNLIGENAASGRFSLATALTAVTSTSQTFTTSATGTISTTVTLPADAVCDYNVTAVHNGQTLGPWKLSATTCPDTLVNTGGSDTMLWAATAGGAIALLGGAAVVIASVRKQRKLAE